MNEKNVIFTSPDSFYIAKKTSDKPGRTAINALFIALIFLQFLDVHSTFKAIADGRSETNVLILKLASVYGLHIAVVIFKVISISIILFYLKLSRSYKHAGVVLVGLAICNIVYLVIVINNYLPSGGAQ